MKGDESTNEPHCLTLKKSGEISVQKLKTAPRNFLQTNLGLTFNAASLPPLSRSQTADCSRGVTRLCPLPRFIRIIFVDLRRTIVTRDTTSVRLLSAME